MEISPIWQRRSLIVPSMQCQSILGKAIQEHFTKPEQIASVFSSSPSLQNSSAGANVLTNFQVDEKSITLFSTIFTPEDTFSLQLAPSIKIGINGFPRHWQHVWDEMFSFMENLIKKTKYIEASLRSLNISTNLINAEQLHFIFSNVTRIKKLELSLDSNVYGITSTQLESSIENLSELTQLRITHTRILTTSTLQLIAQKMTKLEKLILYRCLEVGDEGVLEISKMESLISLELSYCSRIRLAGFNYVASMKNLVELTVQGNFYSKFKNENLQQICSNLLQLKRLTVSGCRVANDGIAFLSSLKSLEYLNLGAISIEGSDDICCEKEVEKRNKSRMNIICDKGIDQICCLTRLTQLVLSHTGISDAGVSDICSSLVGLKEIDLSGCSLLTNKSLDFLKNLVEIEKIVVDEVDLSNSALHSFAMARKATLKILSHNSLCYARIATDYLCDPSPEFLAWGLSRFHRKLTDEVFSQLFELIGDEECSLVEEIDISEHDQPTSATLNLIAEKCYNLILLDVRDCRNISSRDISRFEREVPSCLVLSGRKY
jgi:hypothetical protein